MPYESFSQLFVSLAIVLPRIAGAFLLLPFFTGDSIPPMVRNIFFVALALTVVPLLLQDPPPATLTGAALIPVVVKEIFIGVVPGYAFGIIFWAIEGAGQIIDTKVGTTTAQLADPITGQQTTLLGGYLGRLATCLFAAFGGLHLFVDLLLSSFRVWPVLEPLPDLAAAGRLFFIQRFDELMRLALLLAAPALTILTLVEIALGFVNRYAQQLNVFTLSAALKGWLAAFILLLSIGGMVELLVDWMGDQRQLLTLLPLGG